LAVFIAAGLPPSLVVVALSSGRSKTTQFGHSAVDVALSESVWKITSVVVAVSVEVAVSTGMSGVMISGPVSYGKGSSSLPGSKIRNVAVAAAKSGFAGIFRRYLNPNITKITVRIV